jgi:hypothetical protein
MTSDVSVNPTEDDPKQRSKQVTEIKLKLHVNTTILNWFIKVHLLCLGASTNHT